MQMKPFRFGPLALTNSVANILNPGTTTGGVNSTSSPYDKLRIILTHIRVVDKGGAGGSVTLYIGATGGNAAGTEFAFKATAVATNSFVDWYGRCPLDTGDFLTGLANANTTLTIEGEGEIGVA